MHRLLSSSLVALAALVAAGIGYASASSHPSIHVQPNPVAPGGKVHVFGNAGSCPAGNQLMVISKAFPGHAFGEGSLTGTVRANHTYSIHGHVRAGLQKGSTYGVGARCGGGNLGVSAHLHVS